MFENTLLKFWHQGILPSLQETVKRFLSKTALSVPFENMLSTMRLILNERYRVTESPN